MKSIPEKAFSAALSLLIVLAFSAIPASAAEKETKTSKPLLSRLPPTRDIFNEDKIQVETLADSLEYDRTKKKVIGKGNVTVRHGDTSLTADYAEVETETKKVFATGHVIVFQHGQPVGRAAEIHYDFKQNTGSYPDGRLITLPWFVSGRDVKQVDQDTKVIEDGHITTCDLEKPHVEIRAKKITVHENDKMVAKNIRLYVLGKPIFWWPYLIIPLRDAHNMPFAASVGYNSRFGAFILLTKGIIINKNVNGKVHADWRSERGVGGGLDLFIHEEHIGQGIFKGYLTQDKRAPTVGAVGTDENPFRENENKTRGRLTYLHRADFDPYTNIILRYNRVADEYFLQEFFESESRAEIEPQSFVTLTKNSENYGFFTHVEKKMNNFEAMVERLPEVRFDWKNQPFVKPWLFYENQFSYNNLSKVFNRAGHNEDVNRFDNFHEWSAPMKWREVKVTPFTNLRGTFYSRGAQDPDARYRHVMAQGIDLRTQYYKTFNAASDKLGIEINQLRHVIEPNAQFMTQWSTESDENLGHFDQVDRIDDANILTLGLENRLQTKRVVNGRMQRVDLVSLNTFLSYEIHPDGRALASRIYSPIEDGHTTSDFTVLGQEIVLRPYEWLQYEARFDVDPDRADVRVFNHDIVATFWRRWKLLLGHRYINDYDFGEPISGSDQYVFDTSYVINPLWTIGGYFRWDSKQEGRDEWQVSLVRDLHDFILDFGYNVRNSSVINSNKTLYFNLHLKAFPIIGLTSGAGRSSFSPPRIGETVAGANVSSQANPAYPEGYY